MNFCKSVARVGCLTVLLNVLHVAGGPAGLRGSGQPHQVLIFDAGSSGTRIHVFNIYPASQAQKAHVPEIDLTVREKQTLKVRPGLSSFAEKDDLVGVQQNIAKLLDFANQFVPESHRASTPALLKATAGLRAVQAEKAQAVLARVRETLAESGYRFRSEWADIIQGKEEGGLAWVAANFLQGTFNLEEETSAANSKSLGVIEMGGGSTQVTFEITKTDQVAISDAFTFQTARGRTYRLYAHSYLGYGQDHAQAHLRALMTASETEDPCYPQGYERPGTMGSASWVRGSGSGKSCRANVDSRLLQASEDAPGQYGKELALRPGPFIATENFFFGQKDLSLGFEDRVVSQAEWEEAAENACKTAWQPSEKEAADMHAGNADAGSPRTCFALSYQAMLLQALKASTPGVDVRVARQIKGGDVDWALGAALVHFLQGHAAREPEALSGALGGPTVMLLVAVSVVVAWLVVRRLVPSLCSQRALAQAAQAAGIKPSKIGAGGSPAE